MEYWDLSRLEVVHCPGSVVSDLNIGWQNLVCMHNVYILQTPSCNFTPNAAYEAVTAWARACPSQNDIKP